MQEMMQGIEEQEQRAGTGEIHFYLLLHAAPAASCFCT